ncbi:TadE/TadG family type IV pilus assembly protein [Arthrobacter sp. AB6]|uniref:TadE/TadG family type IV pilus assembly protein n=1 Tax=Arthrobacter sp. AB6 TaxID=2962570 RepID=UPI0028825999|nr:TadE/TadG family type IV pilus assembly protein [Arthrobacter sp. AB6]MDT0195016.1 TadE/TadG family type IV pilus assembly protein [Arthrobacter sp. AB6]
MALKKRTASRSGAAKEKGAAAVEFALVIPLFLMLVFGIVEFGRAFNIQVSLSEAARETARYTAIHANDADFSFDAAREVGISAAPSVDLDASAIEIAFSDGATCEAGDSVLVSLQIMTPYLTPLPGLIPGMPANLDISSKGVMRCGG